MDRDGQFDPRLLMKTARALYNKSAIRGPNNYHTVVLVTVESAFVLPKNGIFRENSVTVMTGTATNMMVSFAQLKGMEYVAVETVNAGMDGMEMHVKSGLPQNILNNYMGEDWILIFLGH
ncbi:hypothetical protein HPG69_009629 [Diceros bicornis minor]|uniref:Uncharacterized protein n=1 Tax=Diceros bicornis minor TaxID=77932 RepID=A0A7J7EX72_DICBM|nr:hypothetical protein HPG69_009629 [Diceros bicornis minor]